jgi:hypothetical protein
MKLGTADVLNGILRIDRPPDGLLEIVLSAGAGEITGTLMDSGGKALPNTRVVLVPAPQRRFRADLFRVAATDHNGRFELKGITPGEYKLFAWDEVENGEWFDPDFLLPFEVQGLTVRIPESGSEEVQLTVIARR